MISLRKTTAWLAVFFAASLLLDRTASAKGRFPRAERLLESPTDSNKLYLAATYGLLLTEDRGQNWHLVCEAAFSLQPFFYGDPLLALAGDESLLVDVQAGLSISRDRGCDWRPSLGFSTTSGQWFPDFTVAPSPGRPIYAVMATLSDGGPLDYRLQKSTDNGATWNPIGAPLPAFTVLTVEVDPTNPRHIYATGLVDASDNPNTGIFLVSPDEGATWSKTVIPGTSAFRGPYIAAVHPTDPRKIFVRTDAWKNRAVIEAADDALLYSSDEGATWKDVLHPGGLDPESPGAKLLGFALSPDGSRAFAGYGDIVDGSRLLESKWFGVYKSSTDGQYSFGADPANPTATIAGPISCITWTTTGLYLCVTPQGEPSSLSFSANANVTSLSQMTRLMVLNQVEAPSPSCAGRSVTSCDFHLDCVDIRACTDAGGPAGAGGGAPVPDASVAGAGGAGVGGGSGRDAGGIGGGGAGAGGGAAVAGAGGAGRAGGTGDSSNHLEKGGCICSTVGATSGDGSVSLWFATASLALVGRRSRRRGV